MTFAKEPEAQAEVPPSETQEGLRKEKGKDVEKEKKEERGGLGSTCLGEREVGEKGFQKKMEELDEQEVQPRPLSSILYLFPAASTWRHIVLLMFMPFD